MQTPQAAASLLTFNKGACCTTCSTKALLPDMRGAVHTVRAWCDFSTLLGLLTQQLSPAAQTPPLCAQFSSHASTCSASPFQPSPPPCIFVIARPSFFTLHSPAS